MTLTKITIANPLKIQRDNNLLLPRPEKKKA